MARILIVESLDIVRFGLKVLLSDIAGFEVVGAVARLDEALAIIEKTSPDLVIAALLLKDSSGLDTVRALVSAQTPRAVLVLAMNDELVYAEHVLQLGAQGYLMTDRSHEWVVRAVTTVLAGQRWVSPEVSAQLLNRVLTRRGRRVAQPQFVAGTVGMSLRELEVLEEIASGRTTKEIAFGLGLSPRTVDVHRASIKKKLGLRSGAELVAFAVSRKNPALLVTELASAPRM